MVGAEAMELQDLLLLAQGYLSLRFDDNKPRLLVTNG